MGEDAPEGVKGGKYGVRLVRGPFVELPLTVRYAMRVAS